MLCKKTPKSSSHVRVSVLSVCLPGNVYRALLWPLRSYTQRSSSLKRRVTLSLSSPGAKSDCHEHWPAMLGRDESLPAEARVTSRFIQRQLMLPRIGLAEKVTPVKKIELLSLAPVQAMKPEVLCCPPHSIRSAPPKLIKLSRDLPVLGPELTWPLVEVGLCCAFGPRCTSELRVDRHSAKRFCCGVVLLLLPSKAWRDKY